AEPIFIPVLRSVIAANPPPLDHQPLVATFSTIYANADLLTPQIINVAMAAMNAALVAAGRIVNGWLISLVLGTYEDNFALRAAVALIGLGANIADDSVYALCEIDATGEPLDGSKSNYQILFPSGQLPPVDPQAFWSITVYDQSGLLVKNPINRYVVGSET